MKGPRSPQLRLAGDIAAHFKHLPADRAAAEVARHIRLFWDPRMRRELLGLAAAGAIDDPLVAAAAARLRDAG